MNITAADLEAASNVLILDDLALDMLLVSVKYNPAAAAVEDARQMQEFDERQTVLENA